MANSIYQLSCGHNWHSDVERWASITTQAVGDVVECKTCAQRVRDENWLIDLPYFLVHHSRFRPEFGGMYHFYRRASDSPSGFFLLGSVHATKAIDEILRWKTNCGPLSPTERA